MTRAEFKAQGGTPRGIDVGGTVDCPGDCSNLIHRTWTATDECGNSAECTADLRWRHDSNNNVEHNHDDDNDEQHYDLDHINLDNDHVNDAASTDHL